MVVLLGLHITESESMVPVPRASCDFVMIKEEEMGSSI